MVMLDHGVAHFIWRSTAQSGAISTSTWLMNETLPLTQGHAVHVRIAIRPTLESESEIQIPAMMCLGRFLPIDCGRVCFAGRVAL